MADEKNGPAKGALGGAAMGAAFGGPGGGIGALLGLLASLAARDQQDPEARPNGNAVRTTQGPRNYGPDAPMAPDQSPDGYRTPGENYNKGFYNAGEGSRMGDSSAYFTYENGKSSDIMPSQNSTRGVARDAGLQRIMEALRGN